jgi:hypothetical protein
MKNQTNNRKSFIIHNDSLEILDQLTDEQAGKLFKAIFYYQKTGELAELDQLIKIAISPFINQFKRDDKKYLNIVERNRINIAKRWKKDTTGKTGIPKDTKNTDNDSKSDSDSDSKKESKKDSRNKKGFIPPTFQDIQNYCKERNSCVDAKKFFDYYVAGDWEDAKGNQVKNWKQKLLTWESKTTNENRPESNTNQHTVDFINKMIGHSLITQIIISSPNKAQIWFNNANDFKKYQNLDIDLRSKVKEKITEELNITNFEPKF